MYKRVVRVCTHTRLQALQLLHVKQVSVLQRGSKGTYVVKLKTLEVYFF